MTKTRNEIAQDFINALVGPIPSDSCLELRQKKPGEKGSRPTFYNSVSQIDVEHMGTDENVWFGIVLRKGGTTTGRVGDLSWGTCAWADFDGLDDAGKVRVIDALKRFPHLPTMIVDSGGGTHAYWRFDRALDMTNDIHPIYLREVVHGLALALGADTGVHDLPRMMRVAGTLNPGNGTTKVYNPPRDVRIVFHDPRNIYSVSDLSRYRKPVAVKAGTIPIAPPANSASTPVIAALKISKKMKDYVLNGLQPGDPLYKSRSELDNAVCVALVSGGHTDADIFAVFREPSYGISAKYQEKGTDGDRYLATTLANARAYLAQRQPAAVQGGAITSGPVLPGVRERGGLIEAEGRKEWYILLDKPIRAVGRFTGAAEGFRTAIDTGTPELGTVYRNFNSDMLASSLTFKKALRNAARWLGNDRDVQLLAMYLDAQGPPLKHAVSTIGWAGKDIVVFPNAQIVNGAFEKDSDYLYSGQMEEARLEACDDWQTLARTALPLAADLQKTGSAAVALGWFMASFLAPQIRALDGGAFPFLMIFGRRTSGKTHLLKALRTMCGFHEEDENSANEESRFTITDLLAQTNTLPVVLDEYDVSKPRPGFHKLLNHAYIAGTASRGQGDLSVKRYRMTAPLAVAGESPFRSEALQARSVMLKFEPDELNVSPYDALMALPRREFALGMYQHVWNADVPVLWKEAERVVSQEIKDIADIRQRKGWTIVALGLMLVRDLLPPGVVDGYIAKLHTWRYEPEAGLGGGSDGKAVLVEAVRIMTELIRERKMQDGQEYVVQNVNGEHLLWIVPALVLPLVEIHARRQSTDLPMARESVLEYMRANHKGQKGLVVRYQDTVKVGGSTRRGIALSLEKVEEDMGVGVDYWLRAAIEGSDKL